MPNDPMPLNISAEQFAALQPATQAQLRSQLTPIYGEDQVAKLGGTAAPTGQSAPQVQQQTTIQIAGTNLTFSPGQDDGLNPDQRLAGYKALLPHATDKEAVIAAAERDGISRAQLTTEAADPAAVAAQQREIATDVAFAPPASPHDYELLHGNAAALSTEALAKFDTMTRQAFHAAGVPTTMAQGLLEATSATAGSYDHASMTDAGRTLRFAEEGALFKKLSANPDEEMRLANLAYSRFPAAYRKTLDESYAMHSARTLVAMAAVGRALEYREARKAKH